ncbi:MAG: Bug family tripartite tricarboxylate transporter substrate binding protein [Candidatus Binatia bacterium]
MRRMSLFLAALGLASLAALLGLSSMTLAQSFFDGKTMRIIVFASPGGGYDAYARLFARHMKKYIPGEQEIIIQNMPGGGGLRASNYMYNVAKPDGLTFEHMSRDMYFAQFTGQAGVQYDVTKSIPIGSATFENRLLWLNKDLAPYQTLKDMKEAVAAGKKIFIGGTGKGSSAYVLWKMAEALAPGVKVDFVFGYPGSTEIHLAVRKGEVMGYGQSKSSFLVQAKDLLKAGKVAILAQIGTPDRKRDPDFANAPTFWELAKSKKDRALVGFVAAGSIAGRPFFLPPGVPADRVKVLREAFMRAARDPGLMAEAKRIKRPIDPVAGEVIEKLYRDVFAVSPEERREITALVTGK